MAVDCDYTLLLVDDNPTNLMLLVKIIELDLPEVRILTASSAVQGLELAACEHIDGAFIDVQMPQMDGLEMCRRLNSNPVISGLPLVLMTAHMASPELRAEGLEVGAYDFITQPISNVEMLARIKVMLRMCDNERRMRDRNESDVRRDEILARKRRWVSGLLISGEGADSADQQALLTRLSALVPEPSADNEQQLFDCLTSDFPEAWKKTFLKLALIDSIPFEVACEISDIGDIRAVFEFLDRHALIQIRSDDSRKIASFSPGVRDFLRSKAVVELDERTRSQVCSIASEVFRQRDDYVEACRCLLAGEQYSLLSQLLAQVGLTLFDRARISDLLEAVATIPDSVAIRCGWMSLFKGIGGLYRLMSDAAVWLELSYQLFEESQQERGLLLSLTYQVYLTLGVDGDYQRWEQRLSLLERLTGEQLNQLEASERVRVQIACAQTKLLFAGDLGAVEGLIDAALSEAQREQLTRPQTDLHVLKFYLELLRGRHLVAKAAVEQGFKLALALADEIRLTVMHLVACEMMHAEGDLEGFRQQREWLDRHNERGAFALLLNYYEATLMLGQGDVNGAYELLEVARMNPAAAVDMSSRSRLLQLRGYCHAVKNRPDQSRQDLTDARQLREAAGGSLPRLENDLFAGMTCVALGEYEQAADFLRQGLKQSEEAGEQRYRIGFHAWMMVVSAREERQGEVAAHQAAFLALLKQQRCVYFWGLSADLLTRLNDLLNDKEGAQLQPLRERFLSASRDEQGNCVPKLKVYTLGGFRLYLEGLEFDLSQVGHASRQILALLIISPQRTMSLETLMGKLWPDSPSSRARSSFDAAHSRLRKALEEVFGKQIRQHYLVLEKGMLALKNIWIDSCEVEGLISQAHYALRRGYNWQAEIFLRKADTLWQGEVLAGFELEEDVWDARVEMKRKQLESLEIMASLWCRSRRSDDAERLLRRGLSMDMTRDSMVRQLLEIYRDNANNRAVEELLASYRDALIKEEYDSDEIDELIDALGT